MSNIVAIVGRPNVGKSTLFNKLTGVRTAIVDDTPGVTRDRIYGDCNWLNKTYRLIDTGGIQLKDEPFQKEINMQVDIAIEEADVILFLVNGKEGLTSDDQYIAKLLRKSKKPIILGINKIDDISKINKNEFELISRIIFCLKNVLLMILSIIWLLLVSFAA